MQALEAVNPWCGLPSLDSSPSPAQPRFSHLDQLPKVCAMLMLMPSFEPLPMPSPPPAASLRPLYHTPLSRCFQEVPHPLHGLQTSN